MKLKYLALLGVCTIIAACKHAITPNQLYGKWKYTRIDHPRSGDMTDTVTREELQINEPYIQFTANNQLKIYWGGRVLSSGSFKTEGSNIQFTEQLPNGKQRTFPFFVSKLDQKTIMFETLGSDGSRVTAIKQ